jgi:hypothetical protein
MLMVLYIFLKINRCRLLIRVRLSSFIRLVIVCAVRLFLSRNSFDTEVAFSAKQFVGMFLISDKLLSETLFAYFHPEFKF